MDSLCSAIIVVGCVEVEETQEKCAQANGRDEQVLSRPASGGTTLARSLEREKILRFIAVQETG